MPLHGLVTGLIEPSTLALLLVGAPLSLFYTWCGYFLGAFVVLGGLMLLGLTAWLVF